MKPQSSNVNNILSLSYMQTKTQCSFLFLLQDGQWTNRAPESERGAVRVNGIQWDLGQSPVSSAGLWIPHGDHPRKVPPG